jgi:hypothetical protein
MKIAGEAERVSFGMESDSITVGETVITGMTS